MLAWIILPFLAAARYEVVRRAVEDFRGEARAAGYEIGFHRTGSAHVETDAKALSRVWNLLDNAVKHSPDHRTIEVELNRRHGSVCIAVRDRGIGIPLTSVRWSGSGMRRA